MLEKILSKLKKPEIKKCIWKSVYQGMILSNADYFDKFMYKRCQECTGYNLLNTCYYRRKE